MPSVRERIAERVNALLGVSAYQPAKGYGPELNDPIVKMIREALGGQLQPIPTTKLRWYLQDLERAQYAADAGNLAPAAQLWRAMRRDGTIIGLMGTRTAGMVTLPKRYYGNEKIGESLRAKNGTRSVFDEMHPPAELAALDADGVSLGVGVAELVPVPGRSYPVMVRLDPEYLQYRWAENRWYFLSNAGALPITPGDGRWVLHIPGGRNSPWTWGIWAALGQAFIEKSHARLNRANFASKLANPARVAYAPAGATEQQRRGFISRLIAWGVNSVFELPIGWEAKILESNGRGYEVFQKEVDTADRDYMIAICGQVVTTDGGAGFSNIDVQKAIRKDLLNLDGDSLAFTLNTQTLPSYIIDNFGIEALDSPTIVEWETDEPKDKASQAATMAAVAGAISGMTTALTPYGRRLRVGEVVTSFGIPTEEGVASDGKPEVTEEGDTPTGAGTVAPNDGTPAAPAPANDQAAQ